MDSSVLIVQMVLFVFLLSSEVCFYEVIDFAVHDVLDVSAFFSSSEVFYHLVGLEDV